MPVTRLTLADFRSYVTLDFAPGPGLVVLTGPNGAGKTNILEAVSLLAPGRGLRGAALGAMVRTGSAGGFTVGARLGDVDLGTGTRADAPERRVVRINGAAASATALTEWLSLVWLTPAQDRLFAATPGERRRFLDRLVLASDPGHAHHSARYDAAMRQRNRLLAEGRYDESWLLALERAMQEHGDAVVSARLQTVIAIADAQEQSAADFPQFRLQLSETLGPGALAARLRASRAQDASAARARHGPHTQDLLVTLSAKNQPAAHSSTGEQKALLLGIVLAHADLVAQMRGSRPVLLLDEVAAHLDPMRRAALFERLHVPGQQVWMTGTETALFHDLPGVPSRHSVGPGGVCYQAA